MASVLWAPTLYIVHPWNTPRDPSGLLGGLLGTVGAHETLLGCPGSFGEALGFCVCLLAFVLWFCVQLITKNIICCRFLLRKSYLENYRGPTQVMAVCGI